MIIITATFAFDEASKRPGALEIASELQWKTRTEEPGCQAYVFSADPATEDQMAVWELWDDEASLAAHFQHPYYRNMGGSLGGVGLAWAKSAKFRVTASEPVYDDTKTARADFFTADHQEPGHQIFIGGTIDLDDPSERDDLIAATVPHQLATRNDEPGCLEYVFSADPCVENRVIVSEQWENQATLAAHFHHENYVNMGKLFAGLSGRTSNNMKFRVDLGDEVYDETRTPRADFFTA